MTDPKPSSAKLHALHGLRGLMALWVVLGHISLTFGWHLPLIDRNTLAVDVFVLLSGFVISMLLDRKRETYRAYIVRRAFRLFPLYLLILAVSAALIHVQAQAWAVAPTTPSNVSRIDLVRAAISNFPAEIFVHLPLLQGLVPTGLSPHSPFTIVGQAWSISLEWQYYLLAPILMWALASKRRVAPLVGLALTGGLLATAHWFSGGFLGAKILHFLLGMGTYLTLQAGRTRLQIALVVATCGLILLKDGPWQVVPLVVWAAVIYSAAQPAHNKRHLLAKALSWDPLFRMGEVSFSIYLLHMIPLYGSIWLLSRAGLSGPLLGPSVGLATVVVTAGVAALTYRFVEKPGIAVGARLTRHGGQDAGHGD